MKNYFKKFENITDRRIINSRLLQIKMSTRLNAPDIEYRIKNYTDIIDVLEEDEFYDNKKNKKYIDLLKSKNYFEEFNNTEILDFKIDYHNNFKELANNLRKILLSGNYEKSIEFGNKIGEIYQKKDLIWFLIALAHNLNGDVEESIFYYKRSILLNDREVRYYYYLSNAYMDIGDIQNASRYISMALELEPESDYLLESYVYVLLNNNKYDNSISILNELLEKYEDKERINRIISIIYLLKGINYSYKSDDGYIYNVDKNDIHNMIDCIEKGLEFDSSDLYFEYNLYKGKNSLKMCFDLKRIWLLVIASSFYIINSRFLKLIVIGILFTIFISSFKLVCVLEKFNIYGEGTGFDKFCNNINKFFRKLFIFNKKANSKFVEGK